MLGPLAWSQKPRLRSRSRRTTSEEDRERHDHVDEDQEGSTHQGGDRGLGDEEQEEDGAAPETAGEDEVFASMVPQGAQLTGTGE